MAIDGRTLVPRHLRESRQALGVDTDPLDLHPEDFQQCEPDWLHAVRDASAQRAKTMYAEMERILGVAGNRSLTRNQQAAFDELEEDLKTLGEFRNQLDSHLTRPAAPGTRSATDPAGAPVAPAASPQTTTERQAPAPGRNPMTGTIPAARQLLTREQRMADWVRTNGHVPADEPRLDAGKAIRGVLTGNWADADTERRAMAEGTGGAGGYLVPTVLSTELIDLARNKARVMQAGARLFPMTSEVEQVPRQISDPTVSWRLENASIGQGNPTFDQVTFTARSLACIVLVSRELIEDAKQPIDELVREAIAKAIALEIDRVALYGSGTAPQPQGLKGAANVPTASLGTNGAAPTWDNISTAVQTVRGNNFEPSALIDNPRTEGELARQKDTQGRYLLPPVDIADLPRLPTNQVPINETQGTASTASDVFVGDFSQLWIGSRTQLAITVLQERYADFGQVGFVAWWRGDVQVAHPLAFDILTGVL